MKKPYRINISATNPSFFIGLRIAMISFLMIPALINAQELISLRLQDTTIIAVIEEIRKHTEIDFIFNHEMLDSCSNITVEAVNEDVESILTRCLKGTGLAYKKINTTIILIPDENPENLSKNNEYVTGTLRGKVVDSDSKAPLAFATVMILDTYPFRGTTANEEGEFRFDDLRVGRCKIRISYVGYETVILPEIFLGSSKEVNISVALTEKSEAIDELRIDIRKGEAVNQMAIVSARSFRVEETKRYAASINDPARMVLVLAGITGNDDATNEIVIRGNSPNWLLWRMEGVEIPSPNHFSEEGYTSGAVSILSSDLLATSDFYMGAFPAEFGNALSGVFDLKLRNGNNEKKEFSAQAGILGLDISAEGPLKKGYEGSYLLNYRFSSLAILDRLNFRVSENALPAYQDLSFKINLPTEKKGTFSIWGIGGRSEVHEEFIPPLNSTIPATTGYIDFTRSGMYATGITHTFFPDDKSYLKTVLSHSDNYSGEVYELMDSARNLYLNMKDDLQNDAVRFSTMYNRKVSHHLSFRTGLTINNTGFGYTSGYRKADGNFRVYLDGTGRTTLIQSYVQAKFRFSEKLVTSAGFHYAYFGLSDDHSLEPRLGILLNIRNNQKLSFGYGHHSKNEDLPIYFIEHRNTDGSMYRPNAELKMTRSDHFIVGYEKTFGEDLQLKTELYYQHIPNLPVPNNPDKYLPPVFGSIYPDDTLINTGKGKNYGIELTLQKYFTNSYYFLFTTSLFDAKYKPANGRWYNSRYNVNHAVNLVGGKEFELGYNKIFSLNMKIIWSGGKRFIPIDLDASKEAGKAVYKIEELYSIKGPDYFRIDFGTGIHFFLEKTEHIISLDIQNLSNRRNIWSEEYDAVNQEPSYYPLSGFIPIMYYRVEF